MSNRPPRTRVPDAENAKLGVQGSMVGRPDMGEGSTPSSLGLRVERLGEGHVESAAEAVGRAFQDDPGMRWIVPSDRRRARLLPHHVAAFLRYGCRDGEAYTTAQVDGAAVWIPPPGRGGVSFGQMVRCGLVASSFKFTPMESLRASVLGLHTMMLDAAGYREPHWYLWLLAVAPEVQGRGIGSALIAPVLSVADNTGAASALLAVTESNVRFYEKRGFQVVRSAPCPFRGPRCWAMRRPPL